MIVLLDNQDRWEPCCDSLDLLRETLHTRKFEDELVKTVMCRVRKCLVGVRILIRRTFTEISV